MDKQTLISNLNKDLSNELSAIAQYNTYAAKATGPFRPQFAQLFLLGNSAFFYGLGTCGV